MISINHHKSVFFYLLLILPFALITGPLIPEIIINIINIFFLLNFLKKKKIIDKTNKKIIFVMLLIIFYCLIINIINNLDKEQIFKNFFYFRFFIFFFSISWILDDEIKIKKFLSIVVIAIILIVFDLIFQYIFSFNLLGFDALENYKKGMMFAETTEITEIKRYSGFFGDELIAGSYLSKFFILALIYFLIKKSNFLKFFCFIILVFFGIYLSGERSSMMTFLFAFFMMVFLFKNNLRYIFFALIILFTILLNFNSSLKQRFLNDEPFNIILSYNLDKKEFFAKLKNTNHALLFNNSYNLIKKKPFFGYGYKGFKRNCSTYKMDVVDNKICSTHPHNYYLDILTSFGFFGLLLFLSLFLIIAVKTFRISKEFQNITIILYLSLFFIAASGSFFNNWISIIIWLNIGFLYRLSKVNYSYFPNIK